MRLLLGLVILVVLAFLASSQGFWALRRGRLGAALISGGWAIVAVGFAIGPHGAGLVLPEQIAVLSPLIYFLLGWVGMMVGLQMHRSLPKLVGRSNLLIAATDSCLSLAVIGGTVYLLLSMLWGDSAETTVMALLMGVCGMGWSAEVRSLRIGRPGLQPATAAMRIVSGLSSVAAVIVYGLLIKSFAIAPTGETTLIPIGDTVTLLTTSVIVGSAMGLLGLWLMVIGGKDEGEFLVVLIGVVSLSAGSALVIGAAPMFVAMLAGAAIINLPGKPLERFRRVIINAEQPVGMAVMLVAGVLMDPLIGLPGILVVMVVIGGRLLTKGGYAALQFHRTTAVRGAESVTGGLARQSPLAIALAVGFAIPQLTTAIGSGVHLSGQQAITIVVIVGLVSELWPMFSTSDSSDSWQTTSRSTPEGRS